MTDQQASTMTNHLIIGIGCDSGQYYFEVLPDERHDALIFTKVQNVGPALAANVWNSQYRLNNVRRSQRWDDRNWKAEFCRPVSDTPGPMAGSASIFSARCGRYRAADRP